MLSRLCMNTQNTVPYSFRRNGQVMFQVVGPRLDVSSPEKRLALAVLADAVRELGEGGPRAEADEAWFASNAIDHPFAFLPICQSLGLDPEHLRRGLRRLHGHAHAA
jgi:hypothetical protein